VTSIVLLGVFVGVVMGLTGAGGGIIALPLLVMLLNISVTDATPVTLLAVGSTALVGALAGLYYKTLRYRAALLMALTGATLSPLGIALAHRIDDRYLLGLFCVILVYVIYHVWTSKQSDMNEANNPLPCILDSVSGRFVWTSRCSISMMMFGGLAGFLSGLVGVGGGFVITPALYRFTHLPAPAIISTSLAVIAINASAVIASSLYAGHLNWMIAAPFTLGSVGGMLTGRMLVDTIKPQLLKQAYAILMLLVLVLTLSKIFLQ